MPMRAPLREPLRQARATRKRGFMLFTVSLVVPSSLQDLAGNSCRNCPTVDPLRRLLETPSLEPPYPGPELPSMGPNRASLPRTLPELPPSDFSKEAADSTRIATLARIANKGSSTDPRTSVPGPSSPEGPNGNGAVLLSRESGKKPCWQKPCWQIYAHRLHGNMLVQVHGLHH